MTSWRDSVLSFSALPMVGPLLVSPHAAWVWSRDGGRILWANPAGGRRLVAEGFDALQERRWPAGHPLRRDMQSAVRSLPERGALARLRLSDRLPAVPIACNCRRVRTEAERGLLVVAAEASAEPVSLAELQSFFSGGLIRAAILDLDHGIGPADEPGAAAFAADAPYVEFAASDRRLKLVLVENRPAAAGATGAFAAAAPQTATQGADEDAELPGAGEVAEQTEPQVIAGESLEEAMAMEPEAPELREALAAPHRAPRVIVVARPPKRTAAVASSGERRGESARQAESLPWRCEQLDSTSKSTIGQLRNEHRSRVDAGDAALEGRERKLPPKYEETESPEPADMPPTRSVMAGRVPQELSRKAVRFLWQTDAADRVLFVSPGLAQVVGRNAEIVGERLQDVAARLRLDPAQRIARALVQHDTWSGQTAWWPVEGSNVRVPAELTALPVFGSDHSFQGFRGFGVLKPAEALMPAAFEARFGPAGAESVPAQQLPPYEEALATVPANVVPIRADLERMADQHARLTPEERNAFEEIAAALRQRVEAGEPEVRARPAEAQEGPAPARSDEGPAPEPANVEPAPSEMAPQFGIRDALASPEAEGEAAQITEPDAGAELAARTHEADREPNASDEDEPNARDEDESNARDEDEPIAEVLPVEQARPFPGSRPARGSLSTRDAVGGDAERRLQEMTALLDTATDGVMVLDSDGVIESASAGAAALFGLDAQELQGTKFGALLTAEGRAVALDYLSGLAMNGVASLLNEGREIEAQVGSGTIPLFITVGRISGGEGRRFCAVLRDITHWKRTEAELVAARRAAEAASTQKSEFLARVSHEVRTPLNAIIGFAEVMIEERFGPVENDRYREYLRDIRTSGEHVVSLVNDLLDISKIEAGRLDLDFSAVPLNDLVRESIGLMQPQASRAQVVVRSSLSKEVPAIVADRRTLRQIVLNLLSNSVKFTAPGGQVIASTSIAETGEALLRIRDNGEGMSEAELARALEPFRQIATATLADRTGTGLGLPLTKALVEANRASLAIKSARGEGTVVTVTFPATRVLSE